MKTTTLAVILTCATGFFFIIKGVVSKTTATVESRLVQNTQEVRPAPYQTRTYIKTPEKFALGKVVSGSDFSTRSKEILFHKIENVFGRLAVGGAPSSEINKRLAEINAQGAAGLRAVISELSLPAASDSQVRRRIFFVDYLSYRMRWDSEAKDAAVRLAKAPIPPQTPVRYRATTLAEQSELIEALIHLDWDLGLSLIQDSKIPQLRRLGANAAYEHLINSGHPKNKAFDKIRSIEPAFKI
jgi:hypothetical protein